MTNLFRLRDEQRKALDAHAPRALFALDAIQTDPTTRSLDRFADAVRTEAERLADVAERHGENFSEDGAVAAGALAAMLDNWQSVRSELEASEAKRQVKSTPRISTTLRPPELRDAAGKPIPVYRADESMAHERNRGDLTAGSMVRAYLAGPRNDDERRSLAVGTDSAGGYTVPTPLAREFIDLLRTLTRVIQAGAQTVSMPSQTLTMAKLLTDVVPTYRGELGAVSEDQPTLGEVALSANSLAVVIRVSRELLQDSVNIDSIIDTTIANAFSIEVDRAALFGSGTSNEPTGLVNTAGVQTTDMAVNGAALAGYGEVLSHLQALSDANVNLDGVASLMAPRTQFALAALTATDNQPLMAPEPWASVRKLPTTAVPVNQDQGTANDASSIITGDFRDLYIGMRQELQVQRLNERYADTLEVGFLASMRYDIAITRPASFSILRGITP